MDSRPATSFTIEVEPNIPRRLARLDELANNLWYSWDRQTRRLFSLLHKGLWDATGHNPKAFLKRVDEARLVEAADDPVFLSNLNRALSAFDTYHDESMRRNGSEWLRQTDTLAADLADLLKPLLGDRRRLLHMARAARELALPGAAERVADIAYEEAHA